MSWKRNLLCLISSSALTVVLATTAHAQQTTATEQNPGQQGKDMRRASDALTNVIVVTATKRAGGVAVQQAPIAITAYGEEQLEAMRVRDIESLSYSQPNVSLEDVGSIQGTANFSIRGLGINSSIPSIDPTVGVFVDGVYLGMNAGLLFDTFDLEAIEILRGPQGVLFGRNVTGGAVLLRTKGPTDEFEASAQATLETGLSQTYQASVSGPLAPGVLNAKIAAYYNHDDGYFTNELDGESLGEVETFVIRPVIEFTPTDALEIVVRYEHGEAEGDGTIGQNRALYERGTDKVITDEPGFMDHKWDFVSAETNIDVGFGDGVITNIFGWRKYNSSSQSDFDATSLNLLLFGEITEQEQFSNELRYSGRFFDRVDLTVGGFWFDQQLKYQETRFLFQDPSLAPAQDAGLVPPPLSFYGGGIQDHNVLGVFGQAAIDLTSSLALDVGLRWSREEKSVQLATVQPGPASPDLLSIPAGACNIQAGDCFFNLNADPTFQPEDDWNSLSPQVGLRYLLSEDARLYGHWSRAYRSGGYNLRNTVPSASPGPFDQEEVNSFELGLKSEPLAGATFNVALFKTTISDMQREVLLSDPILGTIQQIANTADAEILGFEIEAMYSPVDDLVLTGSVGHLSAEYQEILFDISGDGVVDDNDLALALPRVPEWTYNFGFVYDYDIVSAGILTARANFSHRDSQAFTDNNRGILSGADILDASLSFVTEDGTLRFTVYGSNLLDEITEGSDSQTPFPPGSTNGSHSPLNKGRVFGVSLKAEF